MSWLWGIVLLMVAAVGTIAVEQVDHTHASQRTGYAQVIVGNMMEYRNGVAAYAQAHPTATGAVADTNLALPTWFHRMSEVGNYVAGGQAYVYYVPSRMDGEASQLLQQTNGDLLAGINQNGRLFNSAAGLTSIAVPSAIPQGAVVFAPAALNSAPTAPPPTSPSNCSVAAGTARSWSASGHSCSGTQGSPVVVANNTTLSFSAGGGYTGSAQYLCSNGTLSSVPYPGATCTPPPCNVAAGTSRSWTVGGATCAGAHAAATVTSGSSLTFTSSNGNNGAAGFLCSAGTLSATPDGSQTCTVPPAPCTLPSPSSQTQVSATRTVTQTLGCGSGYYGQITQAQPQHQTETRSAYCPAPTGAYAWGAWSAPSAWTATGGWTTTSSTCTACPGASSTTQAQWVGNSAACPSGYTGSDTWQEEQTRTQTTSYSCPAGTTSLPAPTYSYSGWSWTGIRRNEVNTCAPAVTCSTATMAHWKVNTAGTSVCIWSRQAIAPGYSCGWTTGMTIPMYQASGWPCPSYPHKGCDMSCNGSLPDAPYNNPTWSTW